MIIDLNGTLVDAKDARLDPFDRGFTLGDGIFESLRVESGQPAYLTEHLSRLGQASQVTGIPLPFDAPGIADRIHALCRENGQTEGALRLTVSRGAAARGVAAPDDCNPTVMMALHPLPPGRNDPVAAITAKVTRVNERSPLSRIKATPYLDNILALSEARSRGAQDAVLLNTRDRVVSAAYANLFAVINDAIVTPPLDDGLLPGVTRGRLLQGLRAEERSLGTEDLARADEIFFSNSFGIRPVSQLDGRTLSGVPGPVAGKARALAG